MKILSFWNDLKLWQKVIIGMFLGIAVGHLYGDEAQVLEPIGTVFINLIKMVVIPLIFFSILNGVASVGDASTFGRIGTKALLTYAATTVFAVIIGLSFANIFEPGVGINIDLSHTVQADNSNKALLDILVGLVPQNPFKAMVEANTIQVVIFAFFTGFALILIGDKGNQVRDLVASATQLVFKMIELVIKLTPYGVFALMAVAVGHYGIDVILSLGKFVFTVIAALATQYIFFGIILLLFAGLNPLPFYRKMLETQAVAFATVSSKATLPTAMRELMQKVGVSKQSAAFILPLGASMNMDGVAIHLGICSVFFAQIIGVDLTMTQYLIIILTSTIGSIGAAGFPGGSMVMIGMVLTSVGLPIEGIALILGVDRFLEMLRTVINITGDCTVTVVVDAWEKTLNRNVFYSKSEEDDGDAD
ncbi:MAG: dicarboxylate/amino acid:cation symporter [Candidatus Jidaibacter sp.]|jgi:Na+/H+-dicarboxylate symporter|nr:dicarboxylate/amino acid:cation symporter [Candidatus Jidaibacter sp.]